MLGSYVVNAKWLYPVESGIWKKQSLMSMSKIQYEGGMALGWGRPAGVVPFFSICSAAGFTS